MCDEYIDNNGNDVVRCTDCAVPATTTAAAPVPTESKVCEEGLLSGGISDCDTKCQTGLCSEYIDADGKDVVECKDCGQE